MFPRKNPHRKLSKTRNLKQFKPDVAIRNICVLVSTLNRVCTLLCNVLRTYLLIMYIVTFAMSYAKIKNKEEIYPAVPQCTFLYSSVCNIFES